MRATILAVGLVLVSGPGALAQDSFPAPGFQTNGLAFDGAYLYAVENSGYRTIFVLDPLTGTVVDSFLGPSPTGFDGSGNTLLTPEDASNIQAFIIERAHQMLEADAAQ